MRRHGWQVCVLQPAAVKFLYGFISAICFFSDFVKVDHQCALNLYFSRTQARLSAGLGIAVGPLGPDIILEITHFGPFREEWQGSFPVMGIIAQK